MFPAYLTKIILNFLISYNKRRKKHKKVPTNFQNAKKIALVYEIFNLDQSELINNFIKNIKDHNKELYLLEYLPNSTKATYKVWKRTHMYLMRSNFNFFKLPKKKDISEFTDKEYDILINLTLTDEIYLHYISAITPAHLKMGLYTTKYFDVYDFLIDNKNIKDEESLINMMQSYLFMLNNNQ